MKLVPCLLLLFLCSCGSVRDWHELKTEPMTLGACYDGLRHIAAGARFLEDSANCDRGYGTWQSRWRRRESEFNFPLRNRLRAEIDVDNGSTEEGWLIRYVIEQEKVTDLRRHRAPREEDWSADGQNRELETLFTQALARRLAPKTTLGELGP